MNQLCPVFSKMPADNRYSAINEKSITYFAWILCEILVGQKKLLPQFGRSFLYQQPILFRISLYSDMDLTRFLAKVFFIIKIPPKIECEKLDFSYFMDKL